MFYRKKKRKKNIEREMEKRFWIFQNIFQDRIYYYKYKYKYSAAYFFVELIKLYFICKSLFSFFTLEAFLRQYGVKKV